MANSTSLGNMNIFLTENCDEETPPNGGFFIKEVFQLILVNLSHIPHAPLCSRPCLNNTTSLHSELLPGIFLRSVSYPQFHHNYLLRNFALKHTHRQKASAPNKFLPDKPAFGNLCACFRTVTSKLMGFCLSNNLYTNNTLASKK